MENSHLLILMKEAQLSPEQLAERLGISNMTIRRWMKKSSGEIIPGVYEKAMEDAVYQMMIDGILGPESKSVKLVMKKSQNLSFAAAIKNLGFTGNLRKAPSFSPDRLMVGLSQIGAKESRKTEVDRSHKKIWSFAKLGEEWGSHISTMMRVVRSKNLTMVDKLVAYGALFYLICPFDLIPDDIPVFGLMDDYCVLGLAVAYYVRKYGRSLDLRKVE